MNELLQERYADDPWKLLVSCIMLNQTGRRQVDRVIEAGFFERFPDANSVIFDNSLDLWERVRGLGFGNVRTKRIRDFSAEWARYWSLWLKNPTPEELAEFPGMGPYAVDSYRIFHLRDTSQCDSGDKEILAWAERNGVEWKS